MPRVSPPMQRYMLNEDESKRGIEYINEIKMKEPYVIPTCFRLLCESLKLSMSRRRRDWVSEQIPMQNWFSLLVVMAEM
jgi:hypothetical protein